MSFEHHGTERHQHAIFQQVFVGLDAIFERKQRVMRQARQNFSHSGLHLLLFFWVAMVGDEFRSAFFIFLLVQGIIAATAVVRNVVFGQHHILCQLAGHFAPLIRVFL